MNETAVTGSRLQTPALRILVAEDNLINRALATGILEKLGHTLVARGQWIGSPARPRRNATFDLIFMDVQMPEMDGFEATRRIRAAEAGTSRRTPIIAMTAHAMAGDRERCLAVGMDDYIAKPIRKADLVAVLENGLFPTPNEQASGLPAETSYTRNQMLEQCDGDRQLMKTLIALFAENTPEILATMCAAIAQGNAPALAESAHKLLSSTGAVGAQRALTLARQLEEQGGSGQLAAASEKFAALEEEIGKTCAALAGFTGETVAGGDDPSPRA